MDQRKHIVNYIDECKEEAIDFLKEMVHFDSSSINQGVNGKEKEIQEWLASTQEGWGFDTRLFEPEEEK